MFVRSLQSESTGVNPEPVGNVRRAFFWRAVVTFSTGEPRERRFAAFPKARATKKGGETGFTPVLPQLEGAHEQTLLMGAVIPAALAAVCAGFSPRILRGTRKQLA
jgi:hypothetical protein